LRLKKVLWNKVIPGAFQIAAGWWGHQPGRLAVGGGDTAHKQLGYATI